LDAVGGLVLGRISQAAKQRTDLQKVEALRGIIRQEILFFLNWLQEMGMLLTPPSFTDWDPRDLGPVDEDTGVLLPKTVLPPLHERPQDIPESIIKELHNETVRTNGRRPTRGDREPLTKAEDAVNTGVCVW